MAIQTSESFCLHVNIQKQLIHALNQINRKNKQMRENSEKARKPEILTRITTAQHQSPVTKKDEKNYEKKKNKMRIEARKNCICFFFKKKTYPSARE